MQKKAFAALVLAILAGAQSALAMVSRFPDVLNGTDSAVAIEYLAEMGTLGGYADGTFQPTKTVNRAELMKILVAGQGIEPSAGSYTPACFSDIPAGEWYEKYVCYAYDQGWVAGYADGTFKPAQTVNRAEASKMILNGMGWGALLESPVGSMPFTDVSASDWFAPYAYQIAVHGIDDLSSAFEPGADMTREETAQFMFRIIALQEMEESYYTVATRASFLIYGGYYDLNTLAYPDPSQIAAPANPYLYVNLDNNGNLYVENWGDAWDMSGYTLRDEQGLFSYAFSGMFNTGEGTRLVLNGSNMLGSQNNNITLYDPNGDWVSSWSVLQ